MVNLIPTSSARHLVKSLRRQFKIVLPVFNKDGKNRFPDQEAYIALPGKLSGRTVVLHAGMPDPNGGLAELEMVLIRLREMRVKPIDLFFSYFPYGMQDEVFRPGEINAAEELIKKLVDYYKVRKIFILDAHFSGKAWTKKYPLVFVSATQSLITAASKNNPNIQLISADEGSRRRTNLAGLSKTRLNSFETLIHHSPKLAKQIQGQTIGIIDDIIETGGTLVNVYKKCKQLAAKKQVAIITHGVLDSGIKKIQATYSKLFLTNSINRKQANVDIRSLIIKSLIK